MKRISQAHLPYLAYANPEVDSDIYYLTGFMAPDPYWVLVTSEESVLVANPLEYGRAVNEARTNRVMDSQLLHQKAEPLRAEGISAETAQILVFLKQSSLNEVTVPKGFPVYMARELESKGIKLHVYPERMLSSREIKTGEELGSIRDAVGITERCLSHVRAILAEAEIGYEEKLIWNGDLLTSERIHREIERLCLDLGAEAKHPIVAGGDQACDPHERGNGVLYVNQMIIVDIFPKSKKHHYWGDLTRTFLKGKPSAEQTRLYNTVLEVQQMALSQVTEGANAGEIHKKVETAFENHGYKTQKVNGGYVGFFHGTGHGFGLDIHEPPRIGKEQDLELKAGMVLTVEPGLYYPGIGGCRIEDDVVVREDGCEILSTFPYEWIID